MQEICMHVVVHSNWLFLCEQYPPIHNHSLAVQQWHALNP